MISEFPEEPEIRLVKVLGAGCWGSEALEFCRCDKYPDLLGHELLASMAGDGRALAVMRDDANLHQFGRGTEGGIGRRLSRQYGSDAN